MEKIAILAFILTLVKSIVGDCEQVRFALPPGGVGYTGTVTFEVRSWIKIRFNENIFRFQDGNPILEDPNGISIVAICDGSTSIPVIHIEKEFQDDFLIDGNVKDPADVKFRLNSGYDIVSTIPFHVKIYVSSHMFVTIRLLFWFYIGMSSWYRRFRWSRKCLWNSSNINRRTNPRSWSDNDLWHQQRCSQL